MKIHIVKPNHVLVFAAEELKKYLRMMMPSCEDIEICFGSNEADGFQLGLLEEFGLPCEAEDAVLDDVVHIDTTENGGILAGSNPRSVLFAVYRFLRLNGCRFLYPGVDGEYIPVRDIVATKYHKKADHRFRGHCNEGAESQTCMLETIDFYAKQELNVYMMEFDIPFYYYNSYYMHQHNENNRIPEPVSHEQVLQWKRQCEAEIAKRGLQFHDMGHGWTADPFGISSTDGWTTNDVALTDEQISYLAEINGVRELNNGVALNTNVCMSNPKVRTIMAQSIADYAKKHSNVDYLHVWLADGTRNHCECEECKKAPPSDFYLMIMNEIDEILTERGLSTRIVFIAYVDTMFPPEYVTIKNPKRFSLLYAPITRSYCSSFQEGTVLPPAQKYVRNKWKRPTSAEENIALLKEWQKNWKGCAFSYEYHFWRHQYKDPSGLYIARRIYEDIRSLKHIGLDGFVEDGSQRSFFPNGFAAYIYAETLMNREVVFEEVLEDYYSHIYGDDWKQVFDYIQNVSNAFDFTYMSGELSADMTISKFYNPSRAPELEKVKEYAKQCRELVQTHLSMPNRPQTVSWRLLEKHTEFCEGFAEAMIEKCQGRDEAAYQKAQMLFDNIGKYEVEIERYYDQYMAAKSIYRIVKVSKSAVLQTGMEG